MVFVFVLFEKTPKMRCVITNAAFHWLTYDCEVAR